MDSENRQPRGFSYHFLMWRIDRTIMQIRKHNALANLYPENSWGAITNRENSLWHQGRLKKLVRKRENYLNRYPYSN